MYVQHDASEDYGLEPIIVLMVRKTCRSDNGVFRCLYVVLFMVLTAVG